MSLTFYLDVWELNRKSINKYYSLDLLLYAIIFKIAKWRRTKRLQSNDNARWRRSRILKIDYLTMWWWWRSWASYLVYTVHRKNNNINESIPATKHPVYWNNIYEPVTIVIELSSVWNLLYYEPPVMGVILTCLPLQNIMELCQSNSSYTLFINAYIGISRINGP